ncbi:hypothetical protein [Paenibacillus xylanexedens]|uniref:hypothetical protein n=1 Tax=Paenibacillus xylanexedens TaxID=528191 RepID=UPI0011AA381A|nr:hypothetical protein [Paenibacillus xylanexedens]
MVSEREVRKKLAEHLRCRINMNFELLKRQMNDDTRYLVMYPLIFIEEESLRSNGNLATISNQVMRTSLSWFLKNIEEKGQLEDSKLQFNMAQYEKFKKKFYPFIVKCYQDYRDYLEICDHASYAHSEFVEIEDNKWRVITSLVSDRWPIENFYYERQFEEDSITNNEVAYRQDTEIKFLESTLKSMSGDQSGNNQALYDMCRNNLEFDFKFLGPNPISSLVPDVDIFKKVLAALQYIARVKLNENSLIRSFKGSIDHKSLLIQYKKEDLIIRVIDFCSAPKKLVIDCLDYLSIGNEGSLFEFPLIQTKNKYIFNSSSILVNDWHFAFVNGHYARNVDFTNRDIMVSSKVIDIIEEVSNKAKNIKVAREHYYEFTDASGKKQNSDIDFALYDQNSNTALILEVKWKNNHYISEMDYNHFKIQSSLFQIYNEQIKKHKEFLSAHDNIEALFKCKIAKKPEISYLAIDKRNQLYLGEEKMMSVYMLATFLRAYLNGRSIDLNKVNSEINALQTSTEYFHSNDENIIQIDEITILSDQINSDNYFNL